MKNEMSLMSILGSTNVDLVGHLKKVTADVKRDKQHLVTAAEEFSQKYRDEIAEGTKKRQKLLTEGESQGMSQDEAERYAYSSGFMPTVYTPILNMLYFLLRDSQESIQTKVKLDELTQYYIDKLGYDEFIKRLEEGSTYVRESYADDLADILGDDIEEPEEMDKFVYGNMSHDTFKTIKKLKALSHSSNEKEAFMAYRKCLELCKKYNLEFDMIPCNIKD
jgi:hypothetical protein